MPRFLDHGSLFLDEIAEMPPDITCLTRGVRSRACRRRPAGLFLVRQPEVRRRRVAS